VLPSTAGDLVSAGRCGGTQAKKLLCAPMPCMLCSAAHCSAVHIQHSTCTDFLQHSTVQHSAVLCPPLPPPHHTTLHSTPQFLSCTGLHR